MSVAVGQVWRDEFGNEFVVTGIRIDDRVTLRHVKWDNVRHPTFEFLRANFTLVAAPPTPGWQVS